MQLNEYAQAIAEFERSRKAKPDYWPPYLAQAQLHLKLGMRSQAREMLEAGLQLMPGEPNLTEALRKLGGGPATVARPQAAAAPAAAASR